MSNHLSIEAKPDTFIFGEQTPCLIIIDMQRDFIEKGGFGESLGNNVELLEPAIPAIAKLLACFRRFDLPIVHTREAHKPDLSDCPPSKRLRGKPSLRIGDEGPMGKILIDGERGNAIIDPLKPQANEIEITKPGKGAFYNTALDNMLKERHINDLIFTGVTTEVCVQTSMREANDRGYQCLIAEDATESYFPEFKQATLDMLTAQGAIVGWSSTTDKIIASLEKRYG